MSEEISWSLELAIKPGQVDVVRSLIPEMVDSTRSEPGALIYEWSISDDESVVHSNDRYADSEAVLEHLSAFGEKFAERLLAAGDPTRFVVYGSPTDRAREALDGFGALYMKSLAGFVR
jgi:quinol monooxygenase YgiN